MKTPMLLHIAEPCHENWDAMTPQDKGRHCQSCNKIVVDFSIMTDRQVLDYFKNTTANTCGRFHEDQLHRPIVEPQKQPSKWGYFLASILGLIMSGKTMAQNRVLTGKVVGKSMPQTHNEIVKKETPKQDTIKLSIVLKSKYEVIDEVTGCYHKIYYYRIDGKIIDESGYPIEGADIWLTENKQKTKSQSNGNFVFERVDRYQLKKIFISKVGYEKIEMNLVPKVNMQLGNIVLKKKEEILDEVTVGFISTGRRNIMSGGVSFISSKDFEKSSIINFDTAIKKIQQIFNNEPIKIYPNPAPKNSMIHISIKEAGEYDLHFFDTQSRLVSTKKISTKNDREITEFTLPSNISSGNYIIAIVNNKTQKQVTEKIIIE